MKKKTKLNLAELILAVIFIAATASAATITQKEAPEFYTTEYFEIQFTFFSYPVFSKTRDENDQPRLIIEVKSFMSFSEVLRVQLKDGKESLALAYLEGDEVKWKELNGKQSFTVYECANGSLFGYVYFEYELKRDSGLPPAKCVLAGDLRLFKWDAKRNKHMAGNGGGYVAGGNEPQDFEAFNLAFPATPVTPDKILPVCGKFNLIPSGYRTTMQIKNTLKKARILR